MNTVLMSSVLFLMLGGGVLQVAPEVSQVNQEVAWNEVKEALVDLAKNKGTDEHYFRDTTLPWMLDAVRDTCDNLRCNQRLQSLELLALDEPGETALECTAYWKPGHFEAHCTGEGFAEIWFVAQVCKYTNGTWDGEDTCYW